MHLYSARSFWETSSCSLMSISALRFPTYMTSVSEEKPSLSWNKSESSSHAKHHCPVFWSFKGLSGRKLATMILRLRIDSLEEHKSSSEHVPSMSFMIPTVVITLESDLIVSKSIALSDPNSKRLAHDFENIFLNVRWISMSDSRGERAFSYKYSPKNLPKFIYTNPRNWNCETNRKHIRNH